MLLPFALGALDLEPNQRIMGHYTTDSVNATGWSNPKLVGIATVATDITPDEVAVFSGGKIVAFRVGLSLAAPISRVFVIPIDTEGKLLNDQMVSHGRMHYRQADQLRWEYTSPYTYTFILNKDKVLLKNERRSDVIDVAQNRVFREIARLMMNSIVGNSLADDKNFTTTIAAGNNEWVATLVSKKKDLKQMFQRIVLHIERQKKCVTTVELYEKNGDHTVIQLKNIRINEPVSAQLFKVD